MNRRFISSWQFIAGFGTTLLAVTVSVALMALNSCGAPLELDQAAKDELQKSERVLNFSIELSTTPPSTDGYTLVVAGDRSRELLAQLQSQLPRTTTEIRIKYADTLLDRLGREYRSELFELRYPAADIRRANFDNLTGGAVLDLATSYRPLSGDGAGIIERPCNSSEGGYSPHICNLRDDIPEE